MGPKIAKVPTLAILGLPLGSLEIKSHLDVGPVGGRWWLPLSPGRGESCESELPMVCLSTKSAPTMH